MTTLNGQKSYSDSSLLYEQVAGEIAGLIEQGTFRAGDRIPSIRQLSSRFDVSINTVMQAYALLEDKRLIHARPQSGYFVRSRVPEIREPELQSRSFIAPTTVTISDLCQQVMRNMMNRD